MFGGRIARFRQRRLVVNQQAGMHSMRASHCGRVPGTLDPISQWLHPPLARWPPMPMLTPSFGPPTILRPVPATGHTHLQQARLFAIDALILLNTLQKLPFLLMELLNAVKPHNNFVLRGHAMQSSEPPFASLEQRAEMNKRNPAHTQLHFQST